MLRRFLLVGLFVVIVPGTLPQLIFATMFNVLFFFVQVLAMPYADTADNFLASGSSLCLIVLFFCATLFKFLSVTEVSELQEKMSDEQKRISRVPGVLLSFLSLLAVVGSLALAVTVMLVKLAEERGAFNGMFRDTVTNLLNRKRFEVEQAQTLAHAKRLEPTVKEENETSKSPKACGLNWKVVTGSGAVELKSGLAAELERRDKAAELKGQGTVSLEQATWTAFGLKDPQKDVHFVKAGGLYFVSCLKSEADKPGLKWQVRSAAPYGGVEIFGLAQAISAKSTQPDSQHGISFTEDEWKAFFLKVLRMNHIVKVDGQRFGPSDVVRVPTFLRVGAAETFAGADRCETAIRTRIYEAAFNDVNARGAIVSHDDPKIKHIHKWLTTWAQPDDDEKALEDKLKELVENFEGAIYVTMDIQGFKAVNDRIDHIAGDNALLIYGRYLTKKCEERTRGLHTFKGFRTGGDELSIICKTSARGEEAIRAFAEEVLAFVGLLAATNLEVRADGSHQGSFRIDQVGLVFRKDSCTWVSVDSEKPPLAKLACCGNESSTQGMGYEKKKPPEASPAGRPDLFA